MSANPQWHYDQNSVAHIKADNLCDFAYTLGLLHAKERYYQLALYQSMVRSELSQWSKKEEEAFESDVFMAKAGFFYEGQKEEAHIDLQGPHAFLKSYCEGINDGRRHYRPIDFFLFSYRPKPWTIADTLAIYKATTFFTQARGQLSMEKFVAKGLGKGISPLYFDQLLKGIGHTEQTLAEVIPYLQKTTFIEDPFTRNSYLLNFPCFESTYGWAISKTKTESKNAIMAFDPHSALSTTPNRYFECVWDRHPDFLNGISLVGIPLILMGRNQSLSFCFGPGHSDQIDYFIETIHNEMVQGPDGSEALNTRIMTLKKGKERIPIKIKTYETQRGLIESPLHKKNLSDGHYLSRSWVGQKSDSLTCLLSISEVAMAQNCEEAKKKTQNISASFQWLFCDHQGTISLSRCGQIPKRLGKGLLPLFAWERRHQWQGLRAEDQSLDNPPEGHLICSPHSFPQLDSINLLPAPYSYQRISDHLHSKEKINLLECKKLQSDLYSYQAKAYIDILRPWIPDTPTGRVLRNWDLTYSPHSHGAYLFEQFLNLCYQGLLAPILGDEAWVDFGQRTLLLHSYYNLLDQILLSPHLETTYWFKEVTKAPEDCFKLREHFLKENLAKLLNQYPSGKHRTWSEVNKVTLEHPIFKNTPWPIKRHHLKLSFNGARSTVCKAQLLTKDTAAASAYRFVTTLEKKEAFTVLAGGQNERFNKKAYKSELQRYLNFQYKTLRPSN